MILLAAKNNTHCIFSISHYDYRKFDDLMADGGQPGLHRYSGYGRFSGKTCWIDLPNVSFSELYNDYYLCPDIKKRKYGIHDLSEVRILEESEYPDTDSFFWKRNNAIWGTRGVNGDEPTRFINLVFAQTEHLQNIYLYINDSQKGEDIKRYIESILTDRGINVKEWINE